MAVGERRLYHCPATYFRMLHHNANRSQQNDPPRHYRFILPFGYRGQVVASNTDL